MPTGLSYDQLKDMDDLLHSAIPRSPDATDARDEQRRTNARRTQE